MGLYDAPGGQPVCITYASGEKGSMDRESRNPKYQSTRVLVERWKWHNDLRTGLLIFGTVVGAVAVVLDVLLLLLGGVLRWEIIDGGMIVMLLSACVGVSNLSGHV